MMCADQRLGIYLSVPFCRAKCTFCNFASGVGTAASIERYVQALCAEIETLPASALSSGAELPRTVDSVYFGGGTPSLLTPPQFGRIFAALRGQFCLESDAEITLEAAPGQIAGECLEAAMSLGVNRISLGVQSFVDREAAAVGRLHTGEQCLAEIERLHTKGLRNICADLIAGLPYQTMESWQHSLGMLAGTSLAHVSVYMLEVDEDSRLGAEVLAGGVRFHAHGVPSDDLSADMYELACEYLPHLGLAQYEISNFARAGHASRHNRKYWTREPYLGFGLDAHSMLRVHDSCLRWANADDMVAYMLPGSRGETRVVTARQAFEEAVFLGLRLSAGIARDDLESFAVDWTNDFEERAAQMVSSGMMEHTGDRWSLSPRGRVVSNNVFGELLAP